MTHEASGKLLELAANRPVFCRDCANKRLIAAIFGGKCKAGYYQRWPGYAGFCRRFRARAHTLSGDQ